MDVLINIVVLWFKGMLVVEQEVSWSTAEFPRIKHKILPKYNLFHFCMFSPYRPHIIELGLVDPNVKHESLGYLRLFIKISPFRGGSQEGNGEEASRRQSLKEEKKQKLCSSRVWTNVLTVTLLEGQNFPAMDRNGKHGCTQPS